MSINRYIPAHVTASGDVPLVTDLQIGELATNTQDNRLFMRSGSSVVLLATSTAFSASYALTASYAANGGGSIDFSTGSYTGSFTGSVLGSSSYATTSSAATSLTFVPVTASYALSAGSSGGGVTGAGTNQTLAVWNAGAVSSSILQDNGSRLTTNFPLTASFFKGDGTSITGVISSSYAPLILPAGVVSSSNQINTGSYTGSFTGSINGIGSSLTGVISSSYATTSSYVWSTISSSYALSASYAVNGGGITNFSTGSYTGSFTGSLNGSSSFATTSSAATSLTFQPASASYGITASYSAIAQNVINAIVSASYAVTSSYATLAQNVLGSITSASYALTASYAANGGGGGGATPYPEPYDLPVSPSADNEEFTAALISPWVQFTVPDSSYEEKFGYQGTWFAVRNKGSGTGTPNSQYYKPFTRSGAFTCTFRASIGPKATSYTNATIGFQTGHGGSDTILEFSLEYNSANMLRTDYFNGSSWNYGEHTYQFGNNDMNTVVWYHIERDASNLWSFFASFDGVTWGTFGTETYTFTIAEMFVNITYASSQSGPGISAAIDFVRFDWLTM